MSSNSLKERINITYKAKTDGQTNEVELPLKLLVLSHLSNNEIPIEEKEIISINKNNFNNVMEKLNIKTQFTVDNKLNNNQENLNINLNIKNLKDFNPDSIVMQVPELKQLIELRKSLMALKGPLGNSKEFKQAIIEALSNDDNKNKLLLEIQNKEE